VAGVVIAKRKYNMLKKAERIVGLIKKCLSGDITGEEQVEMESWMNKYLPNQRLFEEMESDKPVEEYMSLFVSIDSEAGWEKIAKGIRLDGIRAINRWWYDAAISVI
jgi:transmembrane sensor